MRRAWVFRWFKTEFPPSCWGLSQQNQGTQNLAFSLVIGIVINDFGALTLILLRAGNKE